MMQLGCIWCGGAAPVARGATPPEFFGEMKGDGREH
jgi:hypothetical protein